MSQDIETFKAFRVEENNGAYTNSIKTVNQRPLNQEEVLVKVHYSSLNYKDALSASGNKGVTRNYPHTPGIDAVGIVTESKSKYWSVGDKVIVTSYDLGMNTDGGFAEFITVPANWPVRLPAGLSMQEAMIYGTAGLTAGMSVMKLIEQVKPEDGDVLVSGATGGVGALSVSILSKLGYSVVAITGKEAEQNYLTELGASKIMLRDEIENFDQKPLLKPQFAGAIDTVGGPILENIIKTTKPLGIVTSCGNVASPKLQLTVFPFILRGVSLIGIDSQNYPMERRVNIWNLLAEDWKPNKLSTTASLIRMDELPAKIEQILKGQLKGRTIVQIAD